jgi:ABC-type spermidine/putrescine transport system permease subunit II
MVESPLTRIALRVATALTLAFIYLPLLVIALYAFNDSRTQAWPIHGVTLRWFSKALDNPRARDALLTSLTAGLGATLLALPAVAAGSIFTFSLTLGDYITPQLVSSKQFIGNVVYANVGVANNLPLAAAFATVPVLVMILYLLAVRRLGAFEQL